MQFLSAQDLEGLAHGLIWGDDSQLRRETVVLFRVLGASHFLAASGANLASLQESIVRFLPRYAPRVTILLITGVLLAYVVEVNEASLWRAFGFWLVTIATQVLGRKTGFFRALIVILVCILLAAPQLLVSVGFQLSLAATCGVFFSRKLLSGENINESFGSRDYLRLAYYELVRSWIVCLFVAPVSWWHFHSISFLSSFSTFLLSPIMGLLFSLALVWEVASTLEGGVGLGRFVSGGVWQLFTFVASLLDILLRPLVKLSELPLISTALFLALSVLAGRMIVSRTVYRSSTNF